MKKYNFGAGPSILPQEVIRATADACLNFDGMDLSLMEISHRSASFQAVIDEAGDLIDVPAGAEAEALAGEQVAQQPIVKDKLPARNEPCPCGSGKKFKNCHGKGIV